MRIKFVIENVLHFLIACKCTVENANLQKTGNERSAWPRFLSDDDSPKRADWQFPDPILAGFFSLSLLLPLLTNAICLAVFYRVTMANVRETSRSPRSTNKKGERRRWSSGKSLPSLPFCEIEGCFYLG